MREFGFQWRHIASNLRTPLDKEDLISTFTRTLSTVYQYMLLTRNWKNFAEITDAGSDIERGIHEGLVQDTPSTSRTPFKKSMVKEKTNEV